MPIGQKTFGVYDFSSEQTWFVCELCVFEKHPSDIETGRANSELANMRVQRVQIKTHRTQKGYRCCLELRVEPHNYNLNDEKITILGTVYKRRPPEGRRVKRLGWLERVDEKGHVGGRRIWRNG